MKVALLTTSYPRFDGDFRGVFIARLADALRQQGVDVRVVEPGGYAALKQGAGLIPNLRTSWLARLEFPFYCLHFLVLAVRRARGCDLLHANWSLAGFFAVVAGRVCRTPVLVTERGQFLIDARNRWINRWLHWVLAGAKERVVISESARSTLESKFPDLSFHVIPNGVDDAAFSPVRRDDARIAIGIGGGGLHIVSVGRLTSVKRLDTLVEALAALARRRGGFRAWIVGDGDERESLRRAVETAGLVERVTLVGSKPPAEAARWMCAGDVFVLCSEGEGGGNVVLEAMSAGLAVVATPVGWSRDFIVDGVNGVHVPVGDARALEGALDELLSSPSRVAGLGNAARRTIEEQRLNWPGCASRYIERYREVLA